MTLDEIMQDIQACQEDLLTYERKYGVLSETFYESYISGEEPADDAWVLDWSDWAGTYEIWRDRQQQYRQVINALQQSLSLAQIIERTAHHDTLPVPSS